MRKYRNMLSRIKGIQKTKIHLYQDKQILSKNDFYVWAKSNSNFMKLWQNYMKFGRKMGLAPSIERINPKLGYVLENMEWITHSENSRRGAISRHHQHRKDAVA